jgi:hypothetical protein
MKVHPIDTELLIVPDPSYCTHWTPLESKHGLPETDIMLPQRSNLR